MKRGIAVDQMMYALLLAIVLVLAIWGAITVFGGSSGIFNKVKTFIPGFGVVNETKYDSQIIAFGLEDGKIHGYDGTDLPVIPEDHVFTVGIQEVSYKSLSDSFAAYYYGSKRDAYKYIDLRNLNYDYEFEMMIGSGGVISPGLVGYIYSFNSEGVIILVKSSDEKVNHGFGTFVFDHSGDLKFTKTGDSSSKDIRQKGTALEQNVYPVISKGAILWRDAIIQGGICERYISISGNNYAVRSLDGVYLVVDLGKPVVGEDKYTRTLSCTKVS